jgi:3-(3-hydroxy-phenyl)propionate hydroxylase
MPPWAGQGMNTGIRDAANLAWKVAAIVQGRAHPGILDSYEAERRPHARAMIGLSAALGRILSPTSRPVAAVRDLFFQAISWAPGMKNWVVQMRFKPMPHYTDGIVVTGGGRRSPAGRMLIQPPVRSADGHAVRLDDVLGPWFAVLGYDTNPAGQLTREQRGFLAALGTRYVTAVAARSRQAGPGHGNPGTTVVEDAGGHLREWFGRNHGRVAVIRPDRYVAALADDSSFGTAAGRLRQLLGAGAAEHLKDGT